jgi:hypothetical protein
LSRRIGVVNGLKARKGRISWRILAHAPPQMCFVAGLLRNSLRHKQLAPI